MFLYTENHICIFKTRSKYNGVTEKSYIRKINKKFTHSCLPTIYYIGRKKQILTWDLGVKILRNELSPVEHLGWTSAFFSRCSIHVEFSIDRYIEKLWPRVKKLLEDAGRGQHFQARGRSFSLYGPILSLPITCLSFFPAVDWLRKGFVNTILSLNRLKCRLCKNTWRANERVTQILDN